MNIEETSLAQIVAQTPMATSIFRKYNLDFCCGGKKTLKDACAEQGIEVNEIKSQLSTLTPDQQEKASDLAVGGITAYIEKRYHQDLRRRLPELIALAQKVERAHAGSADLPEGLSQFLSRFSEEMFTHMNKEEQVLFPMIAAGKGKMAQMPITCMEQEHDEHGKNIRLLKAMTSNFVAPSSACPTWKALYAGLEELEGELMDHINLENNVLFPRALNSLVP